MKSTPLTNVRAVLASLGWHRHAVRQRLTRMFVHTLAASPVVATVGCNGLVEGVDVHPVGVAARDGIGEPCTLGIENEPGFPGFDEREVSIETNSPSCRSGVCLANHFRGRVSCPYGATTSGGCATPGGGKVDPTVSVEAQCTDRRAADAVHCSCRCANAEGRTDDGAAYCACDEGSICQHLVDPVPGEDAVAGSYCVRKPAGPRVCARSCAARDRDASCER